MIMCSIIRERRKMAKRLASIGSKVECVWNIQINNEEMQTFPSEGSAKSYISHYRENNTIFLLKMFRVEIYSL